MERLFFNLKIRDPPGIIDGNAYQQLSPCALIYHHRQGPLLAVFCVVIIITGKWTIASCVLCSDYYSVCTTWSTGVPMLEQGQ